MGFIGGSPRHALWFYGASTDGSRIYGLDPHTVQVAPRRDPTRYGALHLSSEYQHSCSCPAPSEMELKRIDPSLALGFYCKDRNDFDQLCFSLQRLKRQDEPELFSIADISPDYSADVSLMEDIMLRTCGEEDDFLGKGGVHTNDDDDVDDEYIFL